MATGRDLTGRDALDVLAAAEELAIKIAPGNHFNCTLTLLSTALCLAAMHGGIPKSAVVAGLSAAYDNTVKAAPNTAARVKTEH